MTSTGTDPGTRQSQQSARRTDALSRQRIVRAAIEILDADGENALTFRALAARLATGSGAIYHHVADKGDLLATAADEIVARVTTGAAADGTSAGSTTAGTASPHEAIRAVALGLFDAIDTHPWVGAQLAREPAQPALPRIFEAVGGPLQALDVPGSALFDCASALVGYILGVAGQNAANARQHAHGPDRTAYLSAVAARWAQLDPAQYPFVHRVAAQLPAHDDREQFLAGLDLILTGISAQV